jgi:hypothetical protein
MPERAVAEQLLLRLSELLGMADKLGDPLLIALLTEAERQLRNSLGRDRGAGDCDGDELAGKSVDKNSSVYCRPRRR